MAGLPRGLGRAAVVNTEEQRRLAANEAVVRRVNEGIERGQWPGDERDLVSFRCECARLGCNALIELSVTDYERVRSDPCRFVLIAGHELAELETVVEEGDGYVVVEKRREAARFAQKTDPRPDEGNS